MSFDAELFGVHLVETRELPTAESTQALGKELGNLAKPSDYFGLIGDLGAGKTTLLQGFVPAIDSDVAPEAVTSPTYALLNVYPSSPPVYHFDLYRLNSVDDLETVGYWDYIESDGVSCVEWLDQVPQAWPPANTVGTRKIILLDYDGDARIARIFEG